MPSGRLCSATASVSIVLRPRLLFTPSGSALCWCRCGTNRSSASRKRTPTQKPTAAGRKDSFPHSAASSMAGISKLQMEAATITPAAKPVSDRCTRALSEPRMKNTQAEPSAVPTNGIKRPFQISTGIVLPPSGRSLQNAFPRPHINQQKKAALRRTAKMLP